MRILHFGACCYVVLGVGMVKADKDTLGEEEQIIDEDRKKEPDVGATVPSATQKFSR